ncbi:uncharacterized protein A4U43_C02F15970 [Asparagus officinalis]|uniref:Uncharacterized protein n=1 Tax=Asparagus officinalis TaxID=4686 RepID=A0A5P1FNM5_ASPOF|nr:uncharacterized protein A4U43_C02F15970 [Asparagus officinalis]
MSYAVVALIPELNDALNEGWHFVSHEICSDFEVILGRLFHTESPIPILTHIGGAEASAPAPILKVSQHPQVPSALLLESAKIVILNEASYAQSAGGEEIVEPREDEVQVEEASLT